MKLYEVAYKLYSADKVRHIRVYARNKAEAYDKATFEEIQKAEQEPPFSAWVERSISKDGQSRYFNTFEGKPY